MPDKWEFKCYKDRRNIVVVASWVKNDLSKTAWMRLKRALEILSNQKIMEWDRPNASFVSDSDRIYVIRFKDENSTQWRIYGFHDIKLCHFIMTNYGTERGNKYEPTVEKSTSDAESAREICYRNWNESVFTCIQGSSAGLSISSACPS